jgi:hypothetical protein
MTGSENKQPNTPSGKYRKVRVGMNTYIVVGFASALCIFAGIGLLAESKVALGICFFVFALVVFAYFCFQKINVESGIMTFRRPLFPVRRVLLSSVTQVRTVWSGESEFYRRLFFMSGESALCAFNPKLFELADLAFILEQVQQYSPKAVFDEAPSTFLGP